MTACKYYFFTAVGALAFAALALSCGKTDGAKITAESVIPLKEGWKLAVSSDVGDDGSALSTPAYDASGWTSITVPNTVLAALVQAGKLPNPYYSNEMRNFEGYSPGFWRMPDDSPYKKGWWYRKEITLPNYSKKKNVWLNFEGINYKADIWLNGEKIASQSDVIGTFREYFFNVTDKLVFDKPNVLAVQVFAPEIHEDLAISWVDWNPQPPDRNMGLYRRVYLSLTDAPVALRHPMVAAKLEGENKANLTVVAEIENYSDKPVAVTLKGETDNLKFEKKFDLGANEIKDATISYNDAPELILENPRLWFPARMGKPELYTMTLSVYAGERISDKLTFDFGIREITAEMTEENWVQYKINGKKIFINGGGYTYDMLVREFPEKEDIDVAYALDLGLNALRLEGKFETDRFMNKCDKAGLLLIAGWCCCDSWQNSANWSQEHKNIAKESLVSLIKKLRKHPSLLVWWYGSDDPPAPDVERMYLQVLKDLQWPNPVGSSADDEASEVTGPSGVKMTGPYNWIPPSYWLADKQYGGAYGFNTETGPGPSIPPYESLVNFIPKESLWPMDDVWKWHTGQGAFIGISIFYEAMKERLGEPKSLEDFLWKAEYLAYEGERAMFEAYGRNKYAKTTGVIQWMYNNSWPSLIWHLHDYYYRQAGGYFGAKKALEPLHIIYSYDDSSVWIVNNSYEKAEKISAKAAIYSTGSEKLFEIAKEGLSVEADGTMKILELAAALENLKDKLGTAYLVFLTLANSEGEELTQNVYALSTKAETMDFANTDFHHTPVSQYADLKALPNLPATDITALATTNGSEVEVALSNLGQRIAFMVKLRLVKSDGEEIIPSYYSDNYVTLLPRGKKTIKIRFDEALADGEKPRVEVSSWYGQKITINSH